MSSLRCPLAFLAVLSASAVGCMAPPPEEQSRSSSDAISAVDVACTANQAQIVLSSAGAATAVAGYVTAAAIAVEGLVAAGADAQLLQLGRAFYTSLLEVGGASGEMAVLADALSARQALVAGQALAAALWKMGTNGNVKGILTIGYSLYQVARDGLISLDAINPIGIRQNLDYLNDGMRFACTNCGEQWACADGETASRMTEFDPTRHQQNDTPAISRGRDCAAGTTFWSSRSYLEQCTSCCDDAGYTDDATSGFHACRAVCNAAYK